MFVLLIIIKLWNLSTQDGLSLNKPVLIYDHPTMRKVVGDDYPLFFKTKEDFQSKLMKSLSHTKI